MSGFCAGFFPRLLCGSSQTSTSRSADKEMLGQEYQVMTSRLSLPALLDLSQKSHHYLPYLPYHFIVQDRKQTKDASGYGMIEWCCILC